MSRHPVSYEKRIRNRAMAEGKPLFTVEIDRRHCEWLPDEERGRMTMQGPATPEANEFVTRLLLKLSHVPDDKINELFHGRKWGAV